MTVECVDPAACERVADQMVDTMLHLNVLAVTGAVAAHIGWIVWAENTDESEAES
jgi:hypothetical protein